MFEQNEIDMVSNNFGLHEINTVSNNIEQEERNHDHYEITNSHDEK